MENPYVSNGNTLLLPSFVCCADVLGFSDSTRLAFNNNQEDQFLNKILNSLNKAYAIIKQERDNYNNIAEFNLKIFTDNIIIGFPVHNFDFDAGEHELGSIFRIFSEFQTCLALDGFFVRGGIAFGKHFMDEQIVFGDALLEAHDIAERKGPPRICLSTKVIEIVRKQIAFYSSVKYARQYDWLLQDGDGTIFLNYLDQAFMLFPDGEIFFDVLEKHKTEIEKNLLLFKTKPDIRCKYEWLAGYHNYICREIADHYPISYDPDPNYEYEMASECAQKALKYLIKCEDISFSRLI